MSNEGFLHKLGSSNDSHHGLSFMAAGGLLFAVIIVCVLAKQAMSPAPASPVGGLQPLGAAPPAQVQVGLVRRPVNSSLTSPIYIPLQPAPASPPPRVTAPWVVQPVRPIPIR